MAQLKWYRQGPLLLWGAVLALALAVLSGRLQLVNDLTRFLPSPPVSETGQPLSQQQLLHQHLQQGNASRQLVLLLEGAVDPRQLAQASHSLAQQLRQNELFERVENRSPDLQQLRDSVWFQYRLLLDPQFDVGRFSGDGLQVELQQRLQQLGMSLYQPLRPLLPEDPVGAFSRWLLTGMDEQKLSSRYGVWFISTQTRGEQGSNVEHSARQPQTQAVLLLTSRAGSFDLAAQQQIHQTIEQAIQALDIDIDYQLSGAGMIALGSRDRIRAEVERLSLWGTLAILLILAWAYRYWPLLILAALPLASGIVVALALTQLAYGWVHGIALAFSITLLGLAIDYPMHLFSHRQAALRTDGVINRIWPTMRLGLLSTLAGFSAMALADLPGLNQMALLSATGLLVAMFTTRWVLPALLDAIAQPNSFLRPSKPLFRFGWGWLVAGYGLLLMIAAAVLLPIQGGWWQDRLVTLSPAPKALLEQHQQATAQLGIEPERYQLVITGDSIETVLQRCDRLLKPLATMQQLRLIEAYQAPCRWLPSRATQRKRQQQLPDPKRFQQELASMLHLMPFRADAFDPFITALAQSSQLEPLTLDAVVNTATGQLLMGLLRQTPEQVQAVVKLQGVKRPEQLSSLMLALADESQQLSLLSIETAGIELTRQLRQQLQFWVLAGLLSLALMLLVLLRSPLAWLRVCAPVLGGLLVSLTLLRALDQPLSLFHLIALLLVAGLGVDYSLFFQRRENAAEQARSAHGVRVCLLSSLAVFGLLAWSEIPLLRAIGLTVSSGILGCYLLARLGCRVPQSTTDDH